MFLKQERDTDGPNPHLASLDNEIYSREAVRGAWNRDFRFWKATGILFSLLMPTIPRRRQPTEFSHASL